jgi:hypothetical protein
MRIRSGVPFFRAGLALSAIALSFAATALSVSAYPPAQPATSGNVLALSWQPVMLYNLTTPSMVIKYHNSQGTPINGTLFVDVRNAAGQTVYVGTAPLGIVNASASRTVYIPMPLPMDVYNATTFVVDANQGFAISATNSTSILAPSAFS